MKKDKCNNIFILKKPVKHFEFFFDILFEASFIQF